MSVNRQYKDRLFTFIFGHESHKEWTLSLYNAVNHSSYTDAESIIITTIEDMLYMSMKNDVSFLIGDTMNFYEQQSTYNPNMPVRVLIYAGSSYARYIEEHPEFHRYSRKLQKIPAPRCVCFFNGTEDQAEIEVLRLSDACDFPTDIEVNVYMYNINYGHNKELLHKCRPLYEYSWFVNMVRGSYRVSGELEYSVDEALNMMPAEFLIKLFLLANKAEVKAMCFTEYDEERTMRELAEDYLNEGIEIGRKQGLELGEKQGFERGEKQGFERGEKQGFEQGEKQGFEQGLDRAKTEVLKRMLEKDVDINLIADCLDIEVEEIEALKK